MSAPADQSAPSLLYRRSRLLEGGADEEGRVKLNTKANGSGKKQRGGTRQASLWESLGMSGTGAGGGEKTRGPIGSRKERNE